MQVMVTKCYYSVRVPVEEEIYIRSDDYRLYGKTEMELNARVDGKRR